MEQYEKLTDEQLIEKLHSGDRDVTDYLMEKYKMMVRKKARAMYLIGGETEDLIQEGMIGLIKAVRNFDSGMGRSFAGLRKHVYFGKCTPLLRRQIEKNICL